MSPRLPAPFAVLTVLLAAGCTTTAPTTPPAEKPAPTAPALHPKTPAPTVAPADLRPASIKGSEESSTLLDNFTTFVRAVDGQPVSAGRKGWDQAIELKPGSHRLAVEFVRGSFFARTELVLEAKPGATYELRQINDAQVYGQHTFCEFSVTDLATNATVGAPKRVALDKVKAGN